MAGQNNDGLAGVAVKQVALEDHTVVGMQAPNLTPCMKIDENGKSLPVMIVAENGGTQIKTTAGYSCECADTSWLSRCGNYSVKAGNTISFNCGTGGITASTTGPFKIYNRYTDVISTYCFSLNTRLFNVTATKRMQFAGTRCDFNFDTTYFSGNVNFISNVHVNGGMYVNGELICRHMSTQGQINLTGQGPECEGFINPKQNFTFVGGEIPLTITVISGLVDGDGRPCTGTILGTATFAGLTPNIRIQSNAFLEGIAGGEVKPDIKMPAHVHTYITPACSFLKDTTSIFEEAKKLTESKTPFGAKQMFPNGQESFEMFMEQVKEMVEKQAKEWLKNWFKENNPFGS